MPNDIMKKLTLAAAAAALPLKASAEEPAAPVVAGLKAVAHAVKNAGSVVIETVGTAIEYPSDSGDPVARERENEIMQHVFQGDASSPEVRDLYQQRESTHADRLKKIIRGITDGNAKGCAR